MFKRIDDVQIWHKIFNFNHREIKWISIGLVLCNIVGCENGRPVASGPILTSSNIPLIDTIYESGGSVLVTNAGNGNAEIASVVAGAGISNLLGCSEMILAPAESCTISFNVTESGGNSSINIPYSGINGTITLSAGVSWYNSRGGFALVSMSATNNPISFEVNQTATSVVTMTNIGGYTLYDIVIPTPVILSGSATAVISNNSCTGSLRINSSCSYDVNITDTVIEQNQQINLGVGAKYSGPNGETVYSRSLLLDYTSYPL